MPKLACPEMFVVRAAHPPPGFFPSFTSIPFNGAPARALCTLKTQSAATRIIRRLVFIVTLLAFLTACFRVWEETHQSKQKRARLELSVRALLLHRIVAVSYAGSPPGPRPPPGPPGRRRRRRRLLSLAGGRPEPAV